MTAIDRSDIVCIGAVARDRKYQLAEDAILGTSNPATSDVFFGGIAHNVAVNLRKLEVPSTLISVAGVDGPGEEIMAHLRAEGLDTSAIARSERAASASYVAIVGPDGNLVIGIADMVIFDELDVERFVRESARLAAATWVFLDTNPTSGFIEACLQHRREHNYRLIVNTVSAPKAKRLPRDLSGIDYLFCSDGEAIAYLEERRASTPLRRAKTLREAGAENVIVSLGERGVVIATANGSTTLPAVPAVVRDDTGAGDALIAGTFHGLIKGLDLQTAAADGTLLAALTIESTDTVAPDLSPEVLDANRSRLQHAPTPM
jgi:pseudouridine kinase